MPSPPRIDDAFLANLAALWAVDPDLAMAVDALGDADRLTIEKARRGGQTARIAGPDGRPRYLHSKYAPDDEAADLAGRSIRKDALCYVVCGAGLGHVVAELLRRLPADGGVAWIEPDPAILATALECHDLSADLRGGRLTVITAADAGHVHARLSPHNQRIIAGVQFVATPAADMLAGDFYAEAQKAVADFVAFTRTSVVTLLVNNEHTIRNLANNLPHYLAAPGVESLKRRFAGYPAVVVSAGPSLAASLPRLREIADRVVIIAVQTTLKVLLDAGITPHFVTSLDYHEISRRFFEDLPAEQLARVHLVAEPKVNASVTDTFARVAARDEPARPAMISLLGNDMTDRMLGDAAPRRGRLPAGATVAHLALYLAQHLGCEPICFVGQDLGFSNGCYYTPGTAIHRVWAGELNRFNSLESMEWQRIVRSRHLLRQMTDVNGQPIYLEEQLFTYLQQFERDFASAPQTIVDATGGGVPKRGTVRMGLDEVAERFATRPLPAGALAYRESANWFAAAPLAAAAGELDARLDEIADLRAVCTRTLELLGRLTELLETDLGQFNRTLVEVDELRSRVGQFKRVFSLVSYVSQLAEFQRSRADRTLRVEGTEGIEKRRIQLARDQAYVSAIRDGCDRLTGILNEAKPRLEMAADDESTEPETRPASSKSRDVAMSVVSGFIGT